MFQFNPSVSVSDIIPLRGNRIVGLHSQEYNFARQDGWDGPGSKGVTAPVLHLAEEIVEQFAAPEFLVEVGAGRDGSLSFIWDDRRGNFVSLTVGPNDSVGLSQLHPDGSIWEGVGKACNPVIRNQLANAFRFLRPVQLSNAKPVIIDASGGVHWTLPLVA